MAPGPPPLSPGLNMTRATGIKPDGNRGRGGGVCVNHSFRTRRRRAFPCAGPGVLWYAGLSGARYLLGRFRLPSAFIISL